MGKTGWAFPGISRGIFSLSLPGCDCPIFRIFHRRRHHSATTHNEIKRWGDEDNGNSKKSNELNCQGHTFVCSFLLAKTGRAHQEPPESCGPELAPRHHSAMGCSVPACAGRGWHPSCPGWAAWSNETFQGSGPAFPLPQDVALLQGKCCQPGTAASACS